MATKLCKEQQKSFGNNMKYSDFIDGKYFLRNWRLKGPYCSKLSARCRNQRNVETKSCFGYNAWDCWLDDLGLSLTLQRQMAIKSPDIYKCYVKSHPVRE